MHLRAKNFCDVTAALVDWQQTGDEQSLEFIIATTSAELQRLAGVSLRRQGVADRSAVDDALSLVFDHLRRLRGAASGERAVTRFDAARTSGDRHGNAGQAYLAWLVRERSLDVARHRRRLAKYTLPLSDATIDDTPWTYPHDTDDEDQARRIRFQTALAQLEQRLRLVVELLLAGKSQAVIAHMLDVCEGTVSRLRTRAIAELKRLMDERGATVPVAKAHPTFGTRDARPTFTQTPPCACRGGTPAPRAPAASPARARASPRRGRPGPSARA